ncbi:AbrB family transcriptional regulator [Alisedimentitalea sp. MJ-SS2]|uniref:AbrB family transcriptional regulator n=1 Tax=Aliisedimentitalea sp. MJ-SS2 TaxID=3049795 RepID=UPI00290C39F5|nr:AbrB family transcriptional regulator [Alisedimentitalea sp. MJ-SS2]MDU8926811.1 AbrB family transcriptional regulator [Alisedimentitalea sp. MJ-SS2]
MPLTRLALITLALCLCGGLGGWLASYTLLPLPWLLGSLVACAIPAIAIPRLLPPDYRFPMTFRIIFIAIIGLVIGAQVSPELLSQPTALAISMGAIVAFVPIAFAVNYLIFRRIGGYDHATAYYSSAPGGLIEAITMGEEAGADIRRLVTQQFLRITGVIALVPLGLSLWEGHPVGSAAGMGLSAPDMPINWPLLIAAQIAGITLGKLLRLPAWQLTGALLASAALALLGYPLSIPAWLMQLAQVIVGTSLGMRFAGLSRDMLIRGLGLSILSVSAMLILGGVIALLIGPATGQDFKVLLITFAPGGVNEMALVALSLNANPAFVTLHHVFRITVTVLALGVMKRTLTRPKG